MVHLGESTPITTVQDKEILLTSDTGQTFKMKSTDLAEAIRQAIPIATSEKKGLMNPDFCVKTYIIAKDANLILGEGIYVVRSSYYNRAAILMVSNLKSTYLARDEFFDVYTKLEVYNNSSCKITNAFVQALTFYVTKIAL